MFSKINYAVKWIYGFVLDLPFLLKNYFISSVIAFKKLRYNMKNFADVNLKLGIYHLNNQNYNDAIFRFKLIDKFFKPSDPLVNYWLGWAYFLKKDYKKAVIYLEKANGEDKVNLLNFIKQLDTNNVSKVPEQIYSVYRSINAETIVERFISDERHDFPRIIVMSLIDVMNDLPEEIKVLEIGSNVGLVGHEMHKRINNDSFLLTGVEASSEMVYLQGACNRNVFYNKILNLPVAEFLEDSIDVRYNAVLSLDGFSNRADLSVICKQIYDILDIGGYFIFIVKTNDTVNNPDATLAGNYLEFYYNKGYLDKLLQQNKFKIVAISDLGLVMKNNYSIFICKKL